LTVFPCPSILLRRVHRQGLDWGIVSELKPESEEAILSFPLPSGSTLEISTDQTNEIRGHYGIVRREAQVLHACSQSKDLRDPTRDIKDMDFVFKAYWQEALRASEAEIIGKAQEIAQRNDDVKGHLPDSGPLPLRPTSVSRPLQSRRLR
jgi:hypothetical protein